MNVVFVFSTALICACPSKSKGAECGVCLTPSPVPVQQKSPGTQYTKTNIYRVKGPGRENLNLQDSGAETGVKTFTMSCGSYERILSIQDLSEVQNPWKGFTMHRCLVVALAVLLVTSGFNEVHEAIDSFVEETGIRSFIGSVQDGSITQISLWDTFMWWWETEEVGAIRRRKKPISNRGILKPKPRA